MIPSTAEGQAQRDLMSYAWLQQTVAAAENATDTNVQGFRIRFESAIDCMFKVPYWIGPDPQGIGADVQFVRWWAHVSYVNAGYSFAALYRLYRGGFYLEASTILRALSELLAQLYYFANHPDKADKHFTPGELKEAAKRGAPFPIQLPRTGVIQFKQIFDYIAPDYYESYYRMASGMAHGGLWATVFRTDRTTNTSTAPGCHYEEDHASFICNQAYPIMYGFLNRFPEIFPGWDAAAGGASRDAAMNSMDEMMRAQWADYPNQQAMLRVLSKLVGWREPE